jgi:hypothetical protein
MPWQLALYLFLTFLSTQRKQQAHQRGVSQQAAIRDDNEAKRIALEEKNAAKRKMLLGKLGKGNVTKDSVVKSQRIQDLQKSMRQPSSDKLISGSSPQIVKNAMEKAMGDVGTNVQKRGLARANLDARTNQFDKYNPELTDAQVLAQNIASKLKGNEGVMNIGISEAANTYDQGGDILGQLAQLYGMYAMGQSGKDPKIIS